MNRAQIMEKLIECLIQKGADEELACAVIDILETEENFSKMIKTLSVLRSPSRTCILGHAVLISDPEEYNSM